LLRQLGYQATLRNVSTDEFFARTSDSRHKIQIGVDGWIANIPAPSDFFFQVLSCHSFYQDPTSTENRAEFCDPQADQLAREAQAAQQTDPAAARRLWAKVDRIVTDQAPWVPIYNNSLTWFVSARVRNYQDSPYYVGPLLAQIWVR
jgi:peptide/nickel transport system substrate-binding protein